MNKPNSILGRPTSLGARPEFYLVYLLFYFVPWFFYLPSVPDIVAAIIALGVFIPIYLHSMKQQANAIPHIVAMALIGYAVAPFHGSYGVFHIFASVAAAHLRPERKAWLWIIGLTVVFAAFSIISQQNVWNYIFVLVLAIPISIGTMFSAEQSEREKILERSREHDQHLATLAERERIAQDLHDLLGQTLTMITLKSEVATKLFEQDPERAKRELIEIQASSRTGLQEVRDVVAGMNTTTVERELKRAKQVLAAANVSLIVNGKLPELDTQTNTSLGLAVREAITNIVKHSQASEAVFTVLENGNTLQISISDNGDLSQTLLNNTGASIDSQLLESSGLLEGSGLKGLRKRIQSLGGDLKLERSSGLTILLEIPLGSQPT